MKLPRKYCDLHFNQPIPRWDEGLPLGNGKMGALLWGGPERFILSLDRTDLWDTTPCPGASGEEYTYETMVSMARAGDEDGVRRVFDTPYQQVTPCKLPAGRIILRLPKQERWESRLRLAWASACVRGSRLKLECFLSARRDVGILRLNLPPGDFGFWIENPDFGLVGEKDGEAPPGSLKRLHYPPVEAGGDAHKKWFLQRTAGEFAYGIFVQAVSAGDGTMLLFSVAASSDGDRWQERAWEALQDAAEAGYEGLWEEHTAWWRGFWKKSSLTLPDKGFEKNWYLANYLLASCSRKGGYPMALQGVWTADEGTLPPWKGDYHHDLNTQLSYSHYLKANHLEEGECFLDFLWSLREKGRAFARDFYGCEDGLCLPAVMSIDGQSLGGWGMYSLSPTNQIWLCFLFDRHCRYTGEETFLREKCYPFLAETGRCIRSLLEERDGKLYLPVSSSPEIHDDRIEAFLTPNSNYDLSLMRWLFERLAVLAEQLGNGEADVWRGIREKLPELAVDERGVLLLAPGEAIRESHRHHSHLMAIHPLRLIRWEKEEDRRIMDACLLDLEERGHGILVRLLLRLGGGALCRRGPGQRRRPMPSGILGGFLLSQWLSFKRRLQEKRLLGAALPPLYVGGKYVCRQRPAGVAFSFRARYDGAVPGYTGRMAGKEDPVHIPAGRGRRPRVRPLGKGRGDRAGHRGGTGNVPCAGRVPGSAGRGLRLEGTLRRL